VQLLRQEGRSHTEIIHGTGNALATLLKDVGVDHSGSNVVVTEQVLNSANVSSALQQGGREGVAKRMGANLLRHTSMVNRHLDGLVNDTRVHMLATGDATARVNGEIPRRKDLLPTPFCSGNGVFARQRMREVRRARPSGHVLLMERLDPG